MAYIANILKSLTNRRMVDFDPDTASETIVTLNPAATEKCLAIDAGFELFLAGLVHTVGTGTITGFKIFVSDDAAGATNAAVVVSHAIGSNPDAVGDNLWLECTGEQVKAASVSTTRYIGVKITMTTSTDECIVFFERAQGPKYDTLTTDYVS